MIAAIRFMCAAPVYQSSEVINRAREVNLDILKLICISKTIATVDAFWIY